MSNIKYDVEPLFVEPIFRANIGHAISTAQEEFIKTQKMINNKSNLISEELYLLDRPELKSIKAAVDEALAIYAQAVMGISQQLYVTQSWSLINHKGAGMHGHSHSNSLVSGALYFTDLPEPIAGMIFDRHTTYQQLQLRPMDTHQSLYNAPLNRIVPKKGELVMFSSRLQHFVEPNMADEPRYSVSFNSFIRGELGEHREVNTLTLD